MPLYDCGMMLVMRNGGLTPSHSKPNALTNPNSNNSILPPNASQHLTQSQSQPRPPSNGFSSVRDQRNNGSGPSVGPASMVSMANPSNPPNYYRQLSSVGFPPTQQPAPQTYSRPLEAINNNFDSKQRRSFGSNPNPPEAPQAQKWKNAENGRRGGGGNTSRVLQLRQNGSKTNEPVCLDPDEQFVARFLDTLDNPAKINDAVVGMYIPFITTEKVQASSIDKGEPTVPLPEFLGRMFTNFHDLSPMVALIAVVLVARILDSHAGLSVNNLNKYRLIYVSFIVAAKLYEDQTYSNADFAIASGYLPLVELNRLERQFLELLDFNLLVKPVELAQFLRLRSPSAALARLHISPSSTCATPSSSATTGASCGWAITSRVCSSDLTPPPEIDTDEVVVGSCRFQSRYHNRSHTTISSHSEELVSGRYGPNHNTKGIMTMMNMDRQRAVC